MELGKDTPALCLRTRGARALCALATAIALTLALPALASAAPVNDNYTTATTLPLYTVGTGDVTDANEPGTELLTLSSGLGCSEPAANPNFSQMKDTVWYEVTAAVTGTMMATTFGVTNPSPGTGFDSVIAAYDTNKASRNGAPSTGNFLGCNNNGPSFALNRSRVSFPVTQGQTYLIQVGVREGTTPISNTLRITAANEPPEQSADGRTTTTQTLINGSPASGEDNMGATEAPGEDLVCGSGTDASPLGSTVWYRFNVPGYGRLRVTTTGSNGMDSVVQIYRGSATTPVTCNDDAPSLVGASRAEAVVSPGTYLIQVGGFAGRQFGFSITADYDPDADIDNDGFNRPGDCNDFNKAVHIGATDRRGNGVDENCDGVDGQRFDRDGDGFRSNGSPADCNDNNAAIKPGAFDRPGNGIDENCRGGDAKVAAKRKRAIRLKYSYAFNGSGKVTKLTVSATKGTKIRVSCSGARCPKTKTYRSKGKRIKIHRQFKKPLRRATINIAGTKKGWFGRWIRIKVKPNGIASNRDGCLKPGSRTKKRRCPAGS